MAHHSETVEPKTVLAEWDPYTMPLITEDNPAEEASGDDYRGVMSPEGVKVFMHSDGYISRLLDSHGMRLAKSMRFLMRGWQRDGQDLVVGAFTAVRE